MVLHLLEWTGKCIYLARPKETHLWCCGKSTQGNGMRLESRSGRWSSEPFGLGSKNPFFCGDRIRITQSSLWLCSLVAAVSNGALQSERLQFHLRQPETWYSACILPLQNSVPLEGSTPRSPSKGIIICRCCSLISLGTQVVLWKLCIN